ALKFAFRAVLDYPTSPERGISANGLGVRELPAEARRAPAHRTRGAGGAFGILAALLAKPDEVVGKGDLFDTVWPGLVVEENTLQVHISALRKALPPEMIMTVHGRGYKYAGPKP